MAEEYTGEAIIDGVELTGSEVDLYTAERKMIISAIRFSSTHTAEVTVTMYIKPSGDSASVANNFIYQSIVVPGVPANFYERTVVPAGSTISALCSVANVVGLRVSAAVSTT